MKLRSVTLLFAKISLVFTFIVVIAGSVVRMTGSGMGCPDWPKCFGHFIPPVSDDELTFQEGLSFDKGQMMIYHDTLWVANHDVVLQDRFVSEDWHKYPKHDYAIFNALHTWVEYVNRLATVLYAIPVMILSICALLLLFREGNRPVFLLALFADIMIGYEIWLGKLVVDGNLKENSITYHMFGSIAIIALLILLVNSLTPVNKEVRSTPSFKIGVILLLILTFFQIMLGTQVREQVDIVAKEVADRSMWIEMLPLVFKIHRSFSIIVVLLAIWLFMQYRKQNFRFTSLNMMFVLCGLEILIGVVLSYMSMPALMQPAHLLLGVLLFAACFFSILNMNKRVAPDHSPLR
ncbi:MAG: COX15/CtaA family protein [Flavobacteriales bacterium]|nr:COX15/CtaA family protein [Flavobacteriales bacterium]